MKLAECSKTYTVVIEDLQKHSMSVFATCSCGNVSSLTDKDISYLKRYSAVMLSWTFQSDHCLSVLLRVCMVIYQ